MNLVPNERKNVFRFKQFDVHHIRSGMKVGTDGTLLGAWTLPHHATRILDIGTGTGLIALMLAQRTTSSAIIDAVELDDAAYEDALENFKLSPWSERLHAFHTPLQQFTPSKSYDIIVTNPPYFQNSQRPPDTRRDRARHSEHLPFDAILDFCTRWLAPEGRLNLILPEKEGLEFLRKALLRDLHCSRCWQFYTRKEKPLERMLLELSFQNQPTETGEIVLYDAGENWSESYKNLTKDFYLKL